MIIGQFKQQPTLMTSPDASVFSDFSIASEPVSETKKRGKPANPAYDGLTGNERKKAIRKAYYTNKGKLYHGIKLRMDRFDMEKDQFVGCSSVEELNDKVKSHLESQGFSDKYVESLMVFCKRGVEYTPYKSKK
tara:strand:- start:5654 stop:6055 length:402 start_codon:yes stop_codon:yes gene_type:complete